MAITEITAEKLGKKKSGWRWDKKRELFVSFVVDTTFAGARHVRRGFLTEKAAGEYFDQLKVQERLKEIGVVSLVKYPTVKKLFDIHLSKFPPEKSKAIPLRVFKTFTSLLPSNAKTDELKRKHFKDYAELRLSQGVVAETVNREITEISAAIHKAGDYFAELENWQIPKIYRPTVSDEGRSRVVTRDERERLVNYLLRTREAKERPRDYLARRRTGLIAYFAPLTGLRHGEICALKKTDFDVRRRRLKATRFKTKVKGVAETVFEPLTVTQLWILNESEKLYPSGEFFFSERGLIHNKTYSILKAACKKLQIPYGSKTPGGLVLHDMRHTFVTILEHGAVDSSTTRSFSGHSRDGMMKRYAHATPDSRARAMQLIEREVGGSHIAADADAELKTIFAEVWDHKLCFDKFKTAIESFYGFLTEKTNIDVQNVRNVQDADSEFIQ